MMSSIIEDIDFDVDEEEYGIPLPEDPIPTIESIINEDNDSDSIGSDVPSDLKSYKINKTLNEVIDSIDNSSISSFGSKSLKKSITTLNSLDSKTKKDVCIGSVMRCSELQQISAQIKSANSERINSGRPTVVTISSIYIAVGTSHGFILLFDLRQIMKLCLRTSDNFGSVSAMSIKKDNSRLVCGYSRGSVTLWNLQSGELIKVFNELHTPQTSVLYIKYMSDNNFGALSDSSGSVFMLEFRRKDIISECIFSGSRGEVLVIEPLLLPLNINIDDLQHFNNICLLSMATVTKVIAITLRPTICVHFTQVLKGKTDTLPLISWQFVTVQVAEDNRVIDPVLLFARDTSVYFYQASYKSSSKILFTPLMNINLDYTLHAVIWLNPRTIAAINESNEMYVMDVKSQEILDIIDINNIKMVYGSAHFKSLENGQNVSPQMFAAARRACQHSIVLFNVGISGTSSANLLILGLESIHMFSIRNWSDRVDVLVEENKFIKSLDLCLEFYENRAKAMIGLTVKKPKNREIVSKKMIEIINKFVDHMLNPINSDNTNSDILVDNYRYVILIAIKYCVSIEDNQALNDLFERFANDSITKNIFLDSLKTQILNKKFKNLSPFVAKELIVYLEENESFDALESIVAHLEISSLDIHHIMTVCRTHYLYNAIIYIYNNAFDDFMTPFDEMIRELEIRVCTGQLLDPEMNKLGDKLLNYLSCILRGKCFVANHIINDEKKLLLIKEMLLQLTKPIDTKSRYNNPFDDKSFPNLRVVLHFNSDKFFKVLFKAFESFDTEYNEYSFDAQQQKIVDILMQIMIDNTGFNEQEICCLYKFIAKLLSNKRNNVSIKRTHLEEIIDYLFVGEMISFDERQQLLLELIQSDIGFVYDENRILEMAQNGNFFRICEFIYIKNRNWGQNLFTYIRDVNRQSHIIDYINQIILSTNVTNEEKEAFIDSIYSNIESIIEINYQKTAKLLIDILDIEKCHKIFTSLESKPIVLYKLLNGLLLNPTNKSHKRDLSTGSLDLELLSLKEQRKQMLLTDNRIQEKLLELMSTFEPNSVFNALNVLQDYDVDNMLVFTKKYVINEATAYLLEKSLQFEEAFSILYNEINDIINCFDNSNVSKFWDQIENKMIFLVDFCNRCSVKMVDTKQKENLWLKLLESMLTINQLIKNSSKEYLDKLNQLMNRFINNMTQSINMTTVVETIINNLSDAERSGGQLLTIRELLIKVCENYKYEETLLQTTINLILRELHNQLSQLKKETNRANTCRQKICYICSKHLIEEDIILFHCKHCFHEKCLSINNKDTICYICSNDNKFQSSNHLFSKDDNCQQNQQNINRKQQNLNRKQQNLNISQLNALRYIKSDQLIDSRANILNQLPNTRIILNSSDKISDMFKLNLAPQWRKLNNC
ncbi:vacuolar protein sorting-associated protein 8 homolog [Oppia nitens]|uniref:vacuolar protein sorting-associated protein 8 homolog n=1 Tax=Oppia nitens TaxID=1686743 RepID=UPI0023DBF8FA|nr:vacuolar protein sorting-associated protein 8 homolog [Oppia nitens]